MVAGPAAVDAGRDPKQRRTRTHGSTYRNPNRNRSGRPLAGGHARPGSGRRQWRRGARRHTGPRAPPPSPSPAPAPDPAPFVDLFVGYWDMPAYPDGSLPVVNRTAGGCVIVKHSLTGMNRLDQVVLVPGWTYTIVSNGDGTASRVQVDLSNPTTGETASIRVENGKTVIR